MPASKGRYVQAGGSSGAFGDTLAAYFHQEESKTASASWADDSTFAITRLHSNVGLPGTSVPIPTEPTLHLSIAIMPVPFGSYQLEVDGREINVPYIPEFRTSLLDLEAPFLCTLDCAFDYVHYHVPREGLDEIARDHQIKPVENFKFGMCEDDLVIAQLTKNILPLATSRNWSSLLAIDQFSLMFGAHILQTYGGLARLPEVVTQGLAPWQARRAAEVLRSRLDGGVRLNTLAQGVRDVGQPFYTIVSGHIRHVGACLAGAAANRVGEGSDADDHLSTCGHRASVRLFRPGGVQSSLYRGREHKSRAVAPRQRGQLSAKLPLPEDSVLVNRLISRLPLLSRSTKIVRTHRS